MPKRSSKMLADLNELAYSIVNHVGSGASPINPVGAAQKNPAAVELGRLGGKVGGPARARKLSPKKRSEIARKAANARWEKAKGERTPRQIPTPSSFSD